MNDEELGRLLLRPLDTEPTGPNRVDVTRAMQDGRRGRRRRIWAAGAGVTAVITAATVGGALTLADRDDGPVLPPEPTVPASCVVSTLPTGDEKSAEVFAGDPGGTWLLGQGDPFAGGKPSIMVWRDGKLVANLRPQRPEVSMWDINGSGTAVGGTRRSPTVPYLYRDGELHRLRGTGNAEAINDAGMIAGFAEKDRETWPQRWASPDAEPAPMPVPAGATSGRVHDIAEDGTVLVTLEFGGRLRDEPHLWFPDGRVERLTWPVPDAEITNMSGFAFGWVYGIVREPAEGYFRYHPGSGVWQEIGAPAAWINLPVGGNGLGPAPRVFIGKQILDLPTNPPNPDYGYRVDFTSADARTIAGTGITVFGSDQPAVPTLWRCR